VARKKFHVTAPPPKPEQPLADPTSIYDAALDEILALYREDSLPWVVGYSGGKDSTAVLMLVWYALRKLPAAERKKPVYVITTDTRVESPVVSAWVARSLQRMKAAAAAEGLPIEPHLLRPELNDSFWVNLIGRGYPAPRHKFRWCTERLKIRPSNRFIRNVVRASGECVLVLGTRKTESARRAATMAEHDRKRLRDRLTPNAGLPGSLVYTPVESWTTDEVWMYLMQVKNPWGHSNRDLMTLYAGASADNECPLVVDTSTPSCGNSRFGCWVCTMVERDRSMEAMINNDPDKEWMEPLLELRNALNEPDHDRRDYRRMNGTVQLFHDGPIHGPYTRVWREEWLARVLRIQRDLRKAGPPEARDIELIGMDELAEIRRIWLYDKREFDDSLPRIFQEATGQPFPKPVGEDGALGALHHGVLAEVCGDDPVLLDLTAQLLAIEHEHRTQVRRVGIIKEIEKTLANRGHRSKEEAVAEAEERRRATLGEPAP
jgi:DNA sulfur modification protein DndC